MVVCPFPGMPFISSLVFSVILVFLVDATQSKNERDSMQTSSFFFLSVFPRLYLFFLSFRSSSFFSRPSLSLSKSSSFAFSASCSPISSQSMFFFPCLLAQLFANQRVWRKSQPHGSLLARSFSWFLLLYALFFCFSSYQRWSSSSLHPSSASTNISRVLSSSSVAQVM